MRTLKKTEFPGWCREKGIESGEREWPHYSDAQPRSFLIKLPDSAARTVALARMCFPFGDGVTFQGAMIWFREWGIWSEMDEETGLQAVKRLRGALGETTSLADAPGHVFANDEVADARAFWTLPVIFGWDAILFPHEGDYFAFNSHDEVVCFVSRTNEVHNRLLREFSDWKPEEDGWYFH